MDEQRVDEYSSGKDVDTAWKVAADWWHSMMGTMFGADGPGQKYGEEGKNGVTANA